MKSSSVPVKMPISVKEARKLLGHKGKSLNDTQVIEILDMLTAIAESYLKKERSKNTVGNNE